MTDSALPDRLRAHLGLTRLIGLVHVAGDEGYDDARRPWNLAADLHPFAVARPRTVDEAVDVVRLAAGLGLRVLPMNTGHGALALVDDDLDDVVLLRVDGLSEVTIDPSTSRARVLGGTLAVDLVTAAAVHGLTFAHGSAGNVGVAGLVLGGGLSFYSRRHGLTCDALRAAEVITGEGRLVRASATEHPDLFWALRGGATNVGVVVALELDLLPYADVVAGMLFWPIEDAERVVRGWRDWCQTAPESVTTSLRLISFPPVDELPAFLSGQRLVVVDGAVLGDDAHAAEVLAPLRAMVPTADSFGRVPAAELLSVHLDPPRPVPAVGDHSLLAELPDEAVTAFVAGWRETGLFNVELRQLGGRLADRDVQGTSLALPTRAAYVFHAVAVAPSPGVAAYGIAASAQVRAALAEWSVPGFVPTFSYRGAEQRATCGDPERRDRVAAAMDPDGVFARRGWAAAPVAVPQPRSPEIVAQRG